ncbi:23S rRNA (adenine(2030)-N(6))-methyltransferase RlmJ [Azotobacter beijerinckii]|uniref:23S rRNA (adenine(2030)-N(6))-methyltransferase RlmJ n=1 Tax=Azotobacter beijerinckii TaxID=170623 RepID=UPI002952BE4C|nr:23S rRNA (adenine(2030)-N(6))-methyltransferase RlmJ [Azotobacter beijerinckii]MDV7213587.1 23S rRNA (adenine(2030)-N(6))-methyltransferase RlmJ [Azotobacter beijerinckii]
MNYRHAFHAGNHADVLKHLILARLIALLARKEAPFAYLDSHAGVGLYDLQGNAASRTGEWLEGIARLWDAADLPAPAADYLRVVREMNAGGRLRHYPGSPELARRLSRPQDRLLLNEKHPEDGRLLKENMAGDRRVAVHLGEGWHVPRALLPVAEKRALLLIDPPFEQADELERCAQALQEAIARMRQTVVAIWYPIKDLHQLRRFYQSLQKSGAPTLLRAELYVHPADEAQRLNGSGLAIANPPWGLEEELRQLLPWLAEHLAQSQGGWRLDWLVEEQPAVARPAAKPAAQATGRKGRKG